MSYPSISPNTSTYQVQATDEDKIVKSGAAPSSLTSTLPNLGPVSNGFTVGFAMNSGIPHTITIAPGRNENIALYGSYVKSLSLRAENELVLLTIDEVGNWRVTG